MKTSNFIKIFSIIIMSISIMLFSTKVLAADDLGDFEEIDLAISENTNTGNTNNTNSNTNSNTNTNLNSNANNDALNFNKGNNTNSNTNSNNSTNLPKTGIEDSVPVAMLVVVFGISAIYAYKKIKEYRNI